MTKQEESDLIKILDSNPFLQELEKWENDLSSFAEGRIQLQDLNFVLESDKKNFEAYQKKVARRTRNGDTFLHPELLPQPFIGDPRAPIWYLLLNPGYSYPDPHDHIGICPCCNRRVFADVMEPDCIFNVGGRSAEMLKKRQELLLQQLRLECGAPFYLLNDAFNTLPDTPKYKKVGGYRWWRYVLFGGVQSKGFLFQECGVGQDAESVGRKLFAIECCPYHSANFDSKVLWDGSKYTEFWVKLINWGLNTKKKFIVRSKRVVTFLQNNNLYVGDDKGVEFSNWRNVVLTRGNLKRYPKVVDAIVEELKRSDNKSLTTGEHESVSHMEELKRLMLNRSEIKATTSAKNSVK
ncbi:MAG: hypothetical protein IKF72_10120 [Kiritimatiellae bacterium]|nr:hypothetical protein [Kiritimatiellia bacterium]